jgi:hypothetical protein
LIEDWSRQDTKASRRVSTSKTTQHLRESSLRSRGAYVMFLL